MRCIYMRALSALVAALCTLAPCRGFSAVLPKTVDYARFYDAAMARIEGAMGDDLSPYSFADSLRSNVADVGSGKNKMKVETTITAFEAPKLRQIRAAVVKSSGPVQVMNFVIFPSAAYDIPIFGADIVSLPGRPGNHLVCIDLQPPRLTEPGETCLGTLPSSSLKRLAELKDQYGALLPWGGDLPEAAAPFFSPFCLWSKTQSAEVVEEAAFEAFMCYLDVYLDVVRSAAEVQEPATRTALQEGHLAYSKYRSINDPARGMLTRFYGEDWTEEAITGILFDLEGKVADGRV